MNRLLIVDDEHHIVNWLVNLFEGQDNLNLDIYKAYTGAEALNIMKVTKINIILLDINMPEISGLEIAEEILSDWPGCRIIFLTGHQSFDYIYYANKHKLISYLLKTESDEVIVDAVVNAIQSIEAEVTDLEVRKQMISKEKLLHYLFQKECLQDVLFGKHLEDVEKLIEWYGCGFPFDFSQPVFLLYGKLNLNNNNSFSMDRNNFLLRLIQITDQILYDKFQYVVMDVDPSTIVWLLQPSASFLVNNGLSPLIYLKECFDEIIFSVQSNISTEIMLLLYDKAIAIELSGNVFQQLNQYAAYRISTDFFGSFGMLVGEAEEHFIVEQNTKMLQINQWDNYLNDLSVFLNRGHHSEFQKTLHCIEESCKGIVSMHYLPLISLYQRISSMLITYINQHSLSETVATRIGIYQLFYMKDFAGWEDAFTYIERVSSIIFELSSRTQSDKNQKLISTIKSYIHDHLSEDLTLTVISDYVNYNSSYVSRIFKQTTGLSLTDYISQCRLNKAKEMLSHTNETIQIIAQKVGYDTSQYFSMVFRKATGLSPRDYRNESLI